MAHYCTYCEYVFGGPRAVCSYCGELVASDSRPDGDLLAQGYCYAPGANGEAKASGADELQELFGPEPLGSGRGAAGGAGAAGGYYDSLLSSFEGRGGASSGRQEQSAFGCSGAAAPQAAAAVLERSAFTDRASGAGFNFFASFSERPSVAVPERIESPGVTSRALAVSGESHGIARSAREMSSECRRRRLGGAASSVGRRLAWLFGSNGSGARFVRMLLLAVLVAFAIWSARYAIAGAFVWALSTIVPVVVVIYIAYRLIRGR